MSSNNFISINGSTITVNVNTNDVWVFTVINANFMLSKYNGRGGDTVNIISFPNMGDGLFGNIEFSVNNNPCYKGSVENVEGDGKYFDVSPKYVMLKGKCDTYIVSVASPSNCGWSANTDSIKFTYTEDKTEGTITIVSDSEGSFENLSLTVTNCDGLVETVYVSQQPSSLQSNVLNVNPQYITINDDTDFRVNVISICNGSMDYELEYDETEFTLTKTGNIIDGNILSEENATKEFTVKNACESKKVIVNYIKSEETSHHMWIVQGEELKTEVECEFKNATDSFTYEIDSSSNWYIYSYNTDKVKCSKSGSYITVSLGADKYACNDYEIILRNRDNDEVTIIYDIAEGLVVETGVTFTFEDGSTVFTTAITQNAVTDNISFDICVLSYDNDNNAIEWRVKSSTFEVTSGTLSGGTSGNCERVTLQSTEATKKSRLQNYTITLQEQESYKEINVKVSITRPTVQSTSSYNVEISPSSGVYSKSEMSGFQISVTPTYVFNNGTYYIGDYTNMIGTNPSFKGVSAKTESETTGVTITLVNDGEAYDTLIYDVSFTDLENLEEFIICTTATTYDDKTEQSSATACTTISLTAYTAEVNCMFSTGETSVEVSGEAQEVIEYLVSLEDGVAVDLKYDIEFPDWFTITQDEDGENVIIKFKENETYSARTATVVVTQDGGCSTETFTIHITQYTNNTIAIPEFDYLLVRYFWGAENGKDLDTVTVISKYLDASNNEVTSISKPFIGEGVGYNYGTTIPSGHTRWEASNKVVSGTNGEVYIMHAGDNMHDGNECIFIDFKNICPDDELDDLIAQGISKIRVDLYGNWFRTKGDGKLDVSLMAFKGGEMIDDPSDSYNFINSGGTSVIEPIVKNAKVCSQGNTNYYDYLATYTLIGYVIYDVKTASAILTLNTECGDSTYNLRKADTSEIITVTYTSSSNQIKFVSSKDGSSFSGVVVTSTQSWIKNISTTSTTNPFEYTFEIEENTTTSERSCAIEVTQNESGNKLFYTIKQECNSNTFFSLDATTEVKELEIELEEEQTAYTFSVYSCGNYSVKEDGTVVGNRLNYEQSIQDCGSNGVKTEKEDEFGYEHTFNIPVTCGKGSITLTQETSSKLITINFRRKCFCTSAVTVNASVVLSSSEWYETDSNVFNDVTAIATLDKTIECGTAEITVYYGVGDIDNAGFISIPISKGTSSGENTIQLSIGIRDEYDENKPMDCIKSVREGHVITFTNNTCYVGGVINVSIDTNSLCQECDCEVTNVSISPTSGTFLNEGDETIFNLKVETSTCDSCTKGYKLYDPNGRLVTAGTGENTVNITYATAINGKYKLVSDDNTGKTATLSIYKFSAYCLMDIAEKESENGDIIGVASSSITLNYPANSTNVSKYVRLRSRYYTSDTTFSKVSFSVSSDSPDWLSVSGNGESFRWTINNNNTYEERIGIITITQNNGVCNKQTTMKIKQDGLPTSYQLATTSTTIDHDDVEARVSIYSTRNGQPYNQLLFDESCAWLSAPYAQSSNNGTYVYQFTTTPNTGTTERSCTIKVSQENGTDTVNVTVTQKGAPAPPPTPTNCMDVKYITKGLTEPVTVLFKTTNGTQQGGGHSVSNDSTKELCCTGLDGTNLIASCMDETITVGGQKEFTYSSGSTITINLTKPHISELKIQNNENGAAKITMYDGTHTNIIPITDKFGTPYQTVTLSNRGDEQSFGAIFTEERIIDVVYESNQWCSSDSCFVHVTFKGEGITMRKGAENSVVIHEDFGEGFKIVGSYYGSCSGSVICEVNGYQVIVNLIFKDYPSSSNPI